MLQAKQTKCDGLSVLIIMFPMKIAIKKRWIYASFWLLIHRNCGTFQELFEFDLATKSAGGRMM